MQNTESLGELVQAGAEWAQHIHYWRDKICAIWRLGIYGLVKIAFPSGEIKELSGVYCKGWASFYLSSSLAAVLQENVLGCVFRNCV